MRKNNCTEFDILLYYELDILKNILSPELYEAIKRMRLGDMFVEPGYDGEYGVVRIFKPEERSGKVAQGALF